LQGEILKADVSACFQPETCPTIPHNRPKRNPESRLKRLLSGLCSIGQQFTVRLEAESKDEKVTYRGGLSC
jgi:hypothetical protein